MRNGAIILGFFIAGISLVCDPISASKHLAPVFDQPPGSNDHYHGTIKETDTVVTVSPEIRVLPGTGPICSYVVSAIATESGVFSTTAAGAPMTTKKTKKQEEIDRRATDDKSKVGSMPEKESSDEDDDDEEDEESSEEEAATTAVMDSVDDANLPFRVEVSDKPSGRALIRLKDDAILDCSRGSYKFKIAPKRCGDGETGSSAVVEVHVEDTNNHDPELTQYQYTIDVDEGRLYDHVLKLEAKDADCGHPYGEICRFDILDNTDSFQTTVTGILKIVKPLNYSLSASQTISVIAHDCGNRRSKPAVITVKVNQVCTIGLAGLENRLTYVPGDGIKHILPSVSDLKLCDLECQPRSVEGKVQLHTRSTGRKACDRERYNAKTLRSSCAADPATVDLLPGPQEVHLENPTSSLLLDPNSVFSDDLDSDDVYVFDGEKNAVIVPMETTKPHIPDTLTLSFWMKHDKPAPKSGTKTHRLKENILCSSDDHRMNRHHFAVYIRNCKLELLIRRETPNKRRDNEFQPAEWRWHLPQVCDNKWHHYSLSMKFPQIDLYVDGKGVVQTEDNTEILDDWPMHVANDIKTKLVVGACWHGGASRMSQFFKGYLAEMMYLPGRVERPNVLQCALQCKERLDFTGLKQLRDGEEVVVNGDASELTLKTSRIVDFIDLLHKITYANGKSFPKSGSRSVSVSTTLTCVKGDRATEPIQLPLAKINIDVKKAADPSIVLEGSLLLHRPRADVEQGVNIFPDLKITVRGSSSATLDYCKIRTVPALNKEREYFSSPAVLISSLNFDFQHVNDGLLLKGNEKAKSYEALLQQVHYFNSRPADLGKRIFTVQCSMMDGRVKSNEFIVSMSIDAPTMRELKPVVVPAATVNLSGNGKSEEKMKTTTAADGVDDVKIANVHGESQQKEERQKPKSLEKVAKTDTSAAKDKSGSDKVLIAHEEPEHKQHRLTIDKLAADSPRPNVAGPLPLLHQAGIGEGYSGAAGSTAGTGSAIAIVVVVCVGFLLLLIIVGVMKIRSTHRRMLSKQRHGQQGNGEAGVAGGDLAWDDAGLNITVNPLEEVTTAANAPLHEDDYSDSGTEDDDDGSYRDGDDCSDEEDDEEVLPHVSTSPGSRHGSGCSNNGVGSATGLEWDDTTLHHPAVHNPRTHTYRL